MRVSIIPSQRSRDADVNYRDAFHVVRLFSHKRFSEPHQNIPRPWIRQTMNHLGLKITSGHSEESLIRFIQSGMLKTFKYITSTMNSTSPLYCTVGMEHHSTKSYHASWCWLGKSKEGHCGQKCTFIAHDTYVLVWHLRKNWTATDL